MENSEKNCSCCKAFKGTLNIVLVCITLIVLGIIAVNGVINRNSASDTIVVTGSAQKDFVSDLIVWQGNFERRSPDLKTAYEALNADREKISQYLISKGLKPGEFVFSATNFYKDYQTYFTPQGQSYSKFSEYVVSQSVQIQSNEVDRIEKISREVTELINQGIEFISNPPQYYYTQLAQLKLEMIAAASADARSRAEQILDSAKGRIKGLKNATLGIFQITAQNSDEEYVYGGAFNTWSKDKSASITVKLTYKVK